MATSLLLLHAATRQPTTWVAVIVGAMGCALMLVASAGAWRTHALRAHYARSAPVVLAVVAAACTLVAVSSLVVVIVTAGR